MRNRRGSHFWGKMITAVMQMLSAQVSFCKRAPREQEAVLTLSFALLKYYTGSFFFLKIHRSFDSKNIVGRFFFVMLGIIKSEKWQLSFKKVSGCYLSPTTWARIGENEPLSQKQTNKKSIKFMNSWGTRMVEMVGWALSTPLVGK